MRLAVVPIRPEQPMGRYAMVDEIVADGMATVSQVERDHPRKPGAAVIRLVAMVASVGTASCTYNFDRFAAAQDARVGAGGSSGGAGGTAGSGTQYGERGGTTSATGGVAGATSRTGGAAGTPSASGGVAGIAATGGQAGAASGGAAAGGKPGTDAGVADAGVPDAGVAGADASTGSCVGPARGGICWYLGSQGSSCQQVCARHGQPAPEAATHVGTASQGGSLSECGTLLGLLGVSGAPAMGTRSDGLGLGCHVYNTAPWWLSSPNFSVSASHASAKLVCGCTQ